MNSTLDSKDNTNTIPIELSSTSPSLSHSADVTDHYNQQNHNHDGTTIPISVVSPIMPNTITLESIPLNNDNNEKKSSVKHEIKNPLMDGNSNESNNILNDSSNKKKSNWVKFDDEDDNKNGNINNKSNINNIKTSPTIINDNASNLEHKKPGIPTLPGPPNPVQNKISSKLQSNDATPTLAVLSHINLNSVTTSPHNSATRNDLPKNLVTTNNAIQSNSSIGAPMRTIELSTGRVREGFANGDVIVTLLPTNTKWPWITPAIFRPELVPEELMAQGLTLTVEEYVHAMESLVNDYRFTIYNICYKRVLVCWIVFAFCVLLTLLFSGLKGIALFSLGVGWLFLNAAAIFLCMWVKLRLSRGLEKCLARVNKQLIRHKIILVLDDRRRISCHKVNLCFLYFDPAQCIGYLNQFIERNEQNGTNIQAGWEAKLDVDVNDIVIQGSNPVRLSRKQAVAQEIFLSYLQRWGKDFLRRRLDWTVNEVGVHETPRHLMSSICPCQYEEEILNNKIQNQSKKSCCSGFFQNPCNSFC